MRTTTRGGPVNRNLCEHHLLESCSLTPPFWINQWLAWLSTFPANPLNRCYLLIYGRKHLPISSKCAFLRGMCHCIFGETKSDFTLVCLRQHDGKPNIFIWKILPIFWHFPGNVITFFPSDVFKCLAPPPPPPQNVLMYYANPYWKD